MSDAAGLCADAWRSMRTLRRFLPQGGTLSLADRNQRHRVILWLLYLHVLGFALITGNGPQHGALESAALLPWAFAATTRRLPFRARAASASLGLLTASAILVGNSMLSTLMSNLPGMAYRCANDPQWTNEFVSEGSFELDRYTPRDFETLSYTELIHPDDPQRLWEDTQRAVAGPAPVPAGISHSDQRWLGALGPRAGPRRLRSRGRGRRPRGLHHRHHRTRPGHPGARPPGATRPADRVAQPHPLAPRASGNAARQQAHRSSAGLLMMDLDRFKEVNDTFGHRYGDSLLQQVAQRLLTELGQRGTLARLGGDEFGILLPSADETIATQIAQRLVDSLEAQFNIEGQSVGLGASVGVALYPRHGVDSETLLRHADVAMYVAKRAGGGHSVYSSEQDQHSADRLALASELRQAIDNRELVLHYQPTIDCASRKITGVEALVRWQHPRRGLIPPDQFIPLAEQSGAIRPLTTFVLQAALHQCRRWLDGGVDLTMAVNLSMRNLHDPQLPETIAALLDAGRDRSAPLNLEITESTIMADPSRALEVLQRLRDLGVRMAIDDFGTGYSSMAYLKAWPSTAQDRQVVRAEAGHRCQRSRDRAFGRRARPQPRPACRRRGRRGHGQLRAVGAPRLRPGAGLLPRPTRCPPATSNAGCPARRGACTRSSAPRKTFACGGATSGSSG